MVSSVVVQIQHVEVESSDFVSESNLKSKRSFGTLRAMENHNCIDVIRRGNAIFRQRSRDSRMPPKDKTLVHACTSFDGLSYIDRRLRETFGIRIYGRTSTRQSITVHVQKIRPYFFMHCPTTDDMPLVIREMLVTRLSDTNDSRRMLKATFLQLILKAFSAQLSGGSRRRYQQEQTVRLENFITQNKLFTVDSVLRRSFFGYQEKDSVFIQVYCRNEFVANTLIYIAARSVLIAGVSWDVYGLYHHPFRLNETLRNANVVPARGKFVPQYCWVAQFLQDSHCRGMDWIEVIGFHTSKVRQTSTSQDIYIPLDAIRCRPISQQGRTDYSSQVGLSFRERIQCPQNLPTASPQVMAGSEGRRSASPRSVESSSIGKWKPSKTSRWCSMTMQINNLAAPSVSDVRGGTESNCHMKLQNSLRDNTERTSAEKKCPWNHFYHTLDYESSEKTLLSEAVELRRNMAQNAPESSPAGATLPQKELDPHSHLPLYCFRVLYLDSFVHPKHGFLSIYFSLVEKVSDADESHVIQDALYAVFPNGDLSNESLHFASPTSSPASGIVVFPSEAHLVRAACRFILGNDPDVIVCWDHDRNGVNKLKGRYRKLTGVDLHIGRCKRRSRPFRNTEVSPEVLRREYSCSRQPSGKEVRKKPPGAKSATEGAKDNPLTPDNFTEAFGATHEPYSGEEAHSQSNRTAPDTSDLTVHEAMNDVSAEDGRLLINLWKIYRSDHGSAGLSNASRKNDRQTMHTLTAACWNICGWRMAEIPPETFYQELQQASAEVGTSFRGELSQSPHIRSALVLLVTHHTHRHQVVSEIVDKKWKLFDYVANLCLLYGILFVDVLNRGSQFRVESVLSRDIESRGYLYPSIQGLRTSKTGAFSFNDNTYRPTAIPLVLQPRRGFYRDPVIVLDFRSLYPSIMIAYNLCYTTILTEMEDRNADQFSDAFIAPNGERFVSSKVRPGIFPQMLTRVLANRVKANTVKKYATGREHTQFREKLNRLQMGLKNFSNVCYGYTSAYYSGRLPCAQLADAIVMKGREILEETMHGVVTQCDLWKKLFGVSDVEVVYGDTDSLFVHVKGGTRRKARAVGMAIVAWVSEKFPNPISLKLEKIYHPCFLLESKRYTGNAYQTTPHRLKKLAENFEYTWEAKGIECVRRDYNLSTEKLLRSAIQKWFEWQDTDRLTAFLKNAFRDMLTGRVSPSEYVLYPEMKASKFGLPVRSVVSGRLVSSKFSTNVAETVAPRDGYPYAGESTLKPEHQDTASRAKRIFGDRENLPQCNVRFSKWQPSDRQGVTAAMREDRLPAVISAKQALRSSVETLNHERVPYVIQRLGSRKAPSRSLKSLSLMRGSDEHPLHEKVMHPIALKGGGILELDIPHYIKHKIAPPLQRVFKHVGVDITECVNTAFGESCGNQNRQEHTSLHKWRDFAQSGMLKRISRKRTRCAKCNNPLYLRISGSPTNSSPPPRTICDSCQDALLGKQLEQSSINLVRSTRNLFAIHKQCQSCIGMGTPAGFSRDITFSCINCECPTFYERVRECAIHSEEKQKVKDCMRSRDNLSP
ncbi:hypothetical protein XU18_3973 [Perkinsela sp. CCAP 1560/4]|nr:hypothetical protein XU18_3973 [Perkinsela sp. CCAP 1560/4]|eukprot:KNH04876.1 hypothetical protein XU18_3973 [Perkinsela sp. CCAP 1560/4]